LRIVVLLKLCTCNHLVSILLDVSNLLGLLYLKLGLLYLKLGLGVVPRLDGLHDLALLSSLDVNVVIEGVGSSVLLSTADSSVQAAHELVGDLDVESEGPCGDGELGLGVLLVLAAFTAGFLSIVSTSTFFL
jgi:hypothetical protein